MIDRARSRWRTVLAAALVAAAPVMTAALTSPAAGLQQDEPPPYRPVEPPLTNAEVLRLWRAGLGTDLVVAKIRQAPSEDLDVAADALIVLHRAKVSDPVILAMLKRVAARPAPAPAPASPAPESPAPASAPADTVDEAAEDAAAAALQQDEPPPYRPPQPPLTDAEGATGQPQPPPQGGSDSGAPVTAGADAPLAPGGMPAVVARVNGVPIARDAVLRAERAARVAGATDGSPTVAALRRATDSVIDRELLLQEAAAAGITATGDEVRVEITALRNRFSKPGEFQAKMQAEGVSDAAALHRMASDAVVLRKLIDRAVYGGIVVTEQEEREFFDHNPEKMKQRAFAAVQEQIAAFLMQQKRRERLQSHLETLRAAARIEIFQ